MTLTPTLSQGKGSRKNRYNSGVSLTSRTS